MADHAELVKEMIENEKLSSQKRLELARKRRHQQLKRLHDHEKKLNKLEKNANKRKTKTNSTITLSSPKNSKVPRVIRIQFDSGVKLLEAAARNDISEVRALLDSGVSPDVATEDGLTALHQCCIDDSEEMLLVLLKYGASVNARDSELWTPLHAASTCGHLRLCHYLVDRNANLLAVNADGNMPYDICEDEETLEYLETQMANQGVTQELIDETRLSTEKHMMADIKEYERGGDSLALWRDRVGASLLHISASNGYYEVTEYLLMKRLDVNAADNDGWTPVMAAAFWAQIPCLELLARSGADLEMRNKGNKTLLDLVDDVELRQQIEEIKKEAEDNVDRFKRVNSDIRRRSSNNIRRLSRRNWGSSSVRRHSMREKHRLSLKEARDEAKYRISINTDDSPSDDTSAPNSPQAPVTNIDDIDVTISDNNVTTITISSTPADDPGSIPDRQSTEPSNTTAGQASPQADSDKATDQSKSPSQNGTAYTEMSAEMRHNGDPVTSSSLSNRVSATIKLNDDDTVTIIGPTKPSTTTDELPTSPETARHSKAQTTEKPSNGNSHTGDKENRRNKSEVPASPAGSGDPPLKRFSAVGQPAIGEEKRSSKGCCVIS